MAVKRQAPMCDICNTPKAEAVYKDMGDTFYGDTFVRWQEIPCECSKEKYKKAVDKMVDWWATRAFVDTMKHDNGMSIAEDKGTLLLLNQKADSEARKANKESINKFKSKLKELLINIDIKNINFMKTELQVDYDPSSKLREACKYAGVNTAVLPIKTYSYIDENFDVYVKYKYGAPVQKI